MQQHLGDEFIGHISAVTEFGVFVTLQDLYVDGMVHISQIGEDFFLFDAQHQLLTGQNTGQVFGLGDEVKIKVAMVNLDERKIDFVIIQQLSRAGRPIRQKAPRKAKEKEQTKPAKKKQSAKLSLSDDGKIKKKNKKKKKSKNKKDNAKRKES